MHRQGTFKQFYIDFLLVLLVNFNLVQFLMEIIWYFLIMIDYYQEYN